MALLLKIENISKTFPGVRALDNVNIEIDKGEVHAIVGENGAGKTTLMRILSGIYQNDGGQLYFEGKPVAFNNTREAQTTGVAIIHQELNLPVNLRIEENVFLGRFPSNKIKLVNRKKLGVETKELLNIVGLNKKTTTHVEDLSIAEQQLVEIAKALSLNSKLLIMDEPTSALNQQETEKLFSIIRNLKEKGVTVIYISHRLEEIMTLADRITVMRDGRVIDTRTIKETSHELIVHQMTGKTLASMYSKGKNAVLGTESGQEVVMEVSGLSSRAKNLGTVSFKLYKGEILGIAGLLGAGRTELVKAIFGADKKTGGEIKLGEKKVSLNSPSRAIKEGIALLPEDRKAEGLVLNLDIMNNISLTSMKQISAGGFVQSRKRRTMSDGMIQKLRVKCTGGSQVVKFLSGGNQQKVVFAKWLAADPKVLMLDDPTRGVDVGAKSEMYGLIRELANMGIGIVFISSEMAEVVGICDRVLVMRNGSFISEVVGEAITEDNLLMIATGKMIEDNRNIHKLYA